jgi:hypothetical protein
LRFLRGRRKNVYLGTVQPKQRIKPTTKTITGYSNFKPVCFILNLRIRKQVLALNCNRIQLVVRQNLADYYFPLNKEHVYLTLRHIPLKTCTGTVPRHQGLCITLENYSLFFFRLIIADPGWAGSYDYVRALHSRQARPLTLQSEKITKNNETMNQLK